MRCTALCEEIFRISPQWRRAIKFVVGGLYAEMFL
jgi:hypothetical protein